MLVAQELRFGDGAAFQSYAAQLDGLASGLPNTWGGPAQVQRRSVLSLLCFVQVALQHYKQNMQKMQSVSALEPWRAFATPCCVSLVDALVIAICGCSLHHCTFAVLQASQQQPAVGGHQLSGLLPPPPLGRVSEGSQGGESSHQGSGSPHDPHVTSQGSSELVRRTLASKITAQLSAWQSSLHFQG